MIEKIVQEELILKKQMIFDICYYWYFKKIGFQYEPYLCNVCHDLMQKAMNFNDVAIFSFEGSDYRIHFWGYEQR